MVHGRLVQRRRNVMQCSRIEKAARRCFPLMERIAVGIDGESDTRINYAFSFFVPKYEIGISLSLEEGEIFCETLYNVVIIKRRLLAFRQLTLDAPKRTAVGCRSK